MLLDKNDIGNPFLGGKAQSLAELENKGFNIPSWFVVPASVFLGFVNNPNSFEFTLEEAEEILSKVDENKVYAIRSSALAEDGKQVSYAGQFETYLGITKSMILDSIKNVFLSGLSERVAAYTQEQDLKNLIPSVIVQELINADKAGVAFSLNPVTGNKDEIVISAVFGLGSVLVDGTVNADTITLNKKEYTTTPVIAKKELKENYINNQLCQIPLEKPDKPVLNSFDIMNIKDLVYDIKKFKDFPQDIEWAIKDDKLYLLQSRPITTIKNIENTSDPLTTWDNSNIVESYSGVVTPLTYSFIRYTYREVYKQMCRMFKIPKKILEYHDYTFSHMLGYINGRVYYNLISWYKVLTIFPGYNFNKDFMIQMMGAKEPLSQEAMEQIENSKYKTTKFKDTINLIKGGFGLIENNLKIKSLTRKFYSNLAAVQTALTKNKLEDLSLYELAMLYRKIENTLITHWDAPVINDFFAMIYHGILRKISMTWNNGQMKDLYNNLLIGDGSIISTQPAKLINQLATELVSCPQHIETFCSGTEQEIDAILEQEKSLERLFYEYKVCFGFRCLEELKLETVPLYINPMNLYRTVGNMAKKIKADPQRKPVQEIDLRRTAEQEYKQILGHNIFKRIGYKYILSKTRYFVRNRENLRFERTRIFDIVRQIFNQIGKEFHVIGLLDSPRDIYFLELDEILGFIEGNATTKSLQKLVNIRKEEFANNQEHTLPRRFNTHGSVNNNNKYCSLEQEQEYKIKDELHGLGCCHGIVRGVARIVKDPANAVLKQGEILFAERTDPGWVMLFPIASAIVVEKGSLLSHAAIVTREMGIPSVVGVENCLNIIHDGDLVEIDGAKGVVRRLKNEE